MSRAKITELDKQRAFAFGAVTELNKLLGITSGGVGEDEMDELLRDTRNREMSEIVNKEIFAAQEIINVWAEKEPEKLKDFLVFLANNIDEREQSNQELSRTPFPNVMQAFQDYRRALVANATRRVDFGLVSAAASSVPISFLFPVGVVSPYLQIAERALTMYQYAPSLIPLIRDGAKWLFSGVKRMWNNRKLKKLRQFQDIAVKKHLEINPKQMSILRRSNSKKHGDDQPLAIADARQPERRKLYEEFVEAAQPVQERPRAPPMMPQRQMSIVRGVGRQVGKKPQKKFRQHVPVQFDQYFDGVDEEQQRNDGDTELEVSPQSAAVAAAAAVDPTKGAGLRDIEKEIIKYVVFHGEKWTKPKAKKFVKQLELTQYGNVKVENDNLMIKVVNEKVNLKHLRAMPISKSVVYLY